MTSDNEKQNKMKKMKVNKMMNDMAKKMFLNLQLDKHLSTDITREKKKCKSAINFCIQNHHHHQRENIVDVLRVFFTQIYIRILPVIITCCCPMMMVIIIQYAIRCYLKRDNQILQTSQKKKRKRSND